MGMIVPQNNIQSFDTVEPVNMQQTFTNTSSMTGVNGTSNQPEMPDTKPLLSPSGMSTFETNYNPTIKPFELSTSSSKVGNFQVTSKPTNLMPDESDNYFSKEKSPLYAQQSFSAKFEEIVVKAESLPAKVNIEKHSPPPSAISQASNLSKEKSPTSISLSTDIDLSFDTNDESSARP